MFLPAVWLGLLLAMVFWELCVLTSGSKAGEIKKKQFIMTLIYYKKTQTKPKQMGYF